MSISGTFQVAKDPFYRFPMSSSKTNKVPTHHTNDLSYVESSTHHQVHKTPNCTWVWNIFHTLLLMFELRTHSSWKLEMCCKRGGNNLGFLHAKMTYYLFLQTPFVRERVFDWVGPLIFPCHGFFRWPLNLSSQMPNQVVLSILQFLPYWKQQSTYHQHRATSR